MTKFCMIPVRPILLDGPPGNWIGWEDIESSRLTSTTNRTIQTTSLGRSSRQTSGKYGRCYYINYLVKEMACSGSPTLNFQAILKTFKGQATVQFSALEP
ncbi:hypothetical protein RHMOL_Rhmol07G0005100 [Rhododendron molle]|nr:hypothetical protein RHMOL_Rhmol07G0005100 [Rhododendron molle]